MRKSIYIFLIHLNYFYVRLYYFKVDILKFLLCIQNNFKINTYNTFIMENNITLLQNENRELKESNCKIAKQIEELERSLKIQSMKLDYVTSLFYFKKNMKDLENQISEYDSKIKSLNEKIDNVDREMKENMFRLEYLETIFAKKARESECSPSVILSNLLIISCKIQKCINFLEIML